MSEQTNAVGGCCGVEAIVTVDARGQLVLPKDLRARAGIKAGDKLAVVTMQQGDQVCCLSLMRVDALAGMVKQVLGPVLKQMVEEEL